MRDKVIKNISLCIQIIGLLGIVFFAIKGVIYAIHFKSGDLPIIIYQIKGISIFLVCTIISFIMRRHKK